MTPILVFDLDDTLYLERDFARSGFAAVGRHLHAAHGISGFSQACQNLLDQGLRGSIFDVALADLGYAEDEVPVHELVSIYRHHKPVISLAEDARSFLADNRHPKAIITDGPEATQNAKIDGLGIRSLFDLIVTTGSFPNGFGKPHPRAFEQVMRWSGKPGHKHIYIADNPAKDFLAPRQLEWKTVQVNRDGRIHDSTPPTRAHAADAVIGSLEELAPMLWSKG